MIEETNVINETTGVEGQESAAPENNEVVAQATETQSAAEKTEKPVRTEKDAYFADMRRKQELEEARANNAKLQQQIDAANKALGSFFEGESLEEKLDYAQAQAMGVDVSKIREQKQAQERAQAVRNELERYRKREVERMMEDDLKTIQAIDPTITSLRDLPETFMALRFNSAAPMSAEKAYIATKAIENQTKLPKPASAGSISGGGKAESEFFTSEELDSLTGKMLDDPKIMEKAMRSMARLK